MGCLDNVPDVFGGVAEFAAGHAGAQAVVADGYGIILELVSEVVSTFRHGSNEDTNALL